VLSNGRGNKSFIVSLSPYLADWLKSLFIKLAKLVWDSRNQRYCIHLSVEVDGFTFESDEKVVAVDMGVIHPIAVFDGQKYKSGMAEN